MTIERIGCGAGPPRPGAATERLAAVAGRGGVRPPRADQVCVLETNLDNASGELVGYCIERLWDAGALDVYTTAIPMKKNRPGVKLSVLCRPADAAAMEAILFQRDADLGRAALAGGPAGVAAAGRPGRGRPGGRSRGS